MVLRKLFPAIIGAALLTAGGPSMAADYRADEFLTLDLSKAVLSPKRLGPPTEFAPVPPSLNPSQNGDTAKNDTKNNDAKSDVAGGDAGKAAVQKSDVATAEPRHPRIAHRAILHHGPALAHASVEKPRGAARTKLAHRHGNPFDAQARDNRIQAPRIQPHRIQTWPCNSGGICDWKQ